MKRMRQRLFSLLAVAMLILGAQTAKADKDAYAVLITNQDLPSRLKFCYDENKSTYISDANYQYTVYNLNQFHDDPDPYSDNPAWINTQGNGQIMEVEFDESFKDFRPNTCYSWFKDCGYLTTIIGIENLNTSQVVDMDKMFDSCTRLTSLDLSGFNTSNVKYMQHMFHACSSLTTIWVGDGWSVGQVELSSYMFDGCTNLPNYDSSETDKTNANTGVEGYLNKIKVTANSDGAGNYWATYYNGTLGFTADANTTVYQAAVNTGEKKVELTEVTDREIPKGNGVVLKSSDAAIILSLATTTATALTGNELLGTDVDLTAPVNAYCLTNETTRDGGLTPRGVGFYTFSGTIPAHRAYLIVDTSAGSRGFLGFGDDDNATGIVDANFKFASQESRISNSLQRGDAWYSMDGRLVTGQPRKGIYVKNGKKFVIK